MPTSKGNERATTGQHLQYQFMFAKNHNNLKSKILTNKRSWLQTSTSMGFWGFATAP